MSMSLKITAAVPAGMSAVRRGRWWRRQDNDGSIGIDFHLPDPGNQLYAAHARHGKIGNDNLWDEIAQHGQCFDAIGS